MKKKLMMCCSAAMICMLISGCSAKNSDEHPYDYFCDCTMPEQIEEIRSMEFVEDVFSFSLMTFAVPDNGSGTDRQIALMAAPSFDDMEHSCFDRDSLIKEDTAILQSYEKNPIIISRSFAKEQKLDIGDQFLLPNKLTEAPVAFTVGAVYNHEEKFAQYDAVMVCNEQVNSVFFNVSEGMGYHCAYIKATDLQKLTDYMENEFVPAFLAEGLSLQELEAISREEITYYYEDYEEHIHRMG